MSLNQPKFCPSATWNPAGITFVDNNTIGQNASVVFVTDNNSVYVVESALSRVQMWMEGSMISAKNISDGLVLPNGLFVTSNGDVYIDNGYLNGRVDKWAVNGTSSVTVMNVNSSCYSLFIDINDTLYCSLGNLHQVVKTSLNSGGLIPTIVAGNRTSGSASNMFNTPCGIFVDIKLNLYVADYGNHRIQFFQAGQSNGTTLAENSTGGTISFSYPTEIILDADGYLFIVDQNNQRILGSGPTGFRCLIGCAGLVGLSYTLNLPCSLGFDSYGNIFVIDRGNARIQKFLLATNSCNETMTSTQMLTSTMNTEESSTNNIQSTNMTTSSTSVVHQINGISTLQIILTSSINSAKTSTNDGLLTTVVTFTLGTTIPAMSSQTIQQLSRPFVPPVCSNSTTIGANCNISSSLCHMLKPCQNNGNCSNTNTTLNGYICSCSPGFNGIECQTDYRSCKLNTCRNNGICNETSNRTFVCLCTPGWQGINCETQINYCQNVTCLNNGVCRPLFLNYTCECLGNSYSGRHCEITASKTVVLQTVSKSFAYIAIIAILCLAMFIITMDVLKYGFSIDPVHKEFKRIQKTKQVKTAKAYVTVRFIYVNPPALTVI